MDALASALDYWQIAARAIDNLGMTVALVLVYMAVEVIGGLLAHSLALIADAGRMLSDAGALGLTLFAMHGTEIERPLAVVMIGGLATSTLFTLLVLPTFYLQVHGWLDRRAHRIMEADA